MSMELGLTVSRYISPDATFRIKETLLCLKVSV